MITSPRYQGYFHEKVPINVSWLVFGAKRKLRVMESGCGFMGSVCSRCCRDYYLYADLAEL